MLFIIEYPSFSFISPTAYNFLKLFLEEIEAQNDNKIILDRKKKCKNGKKKQPRFNKFSEIHIKITKITEFVKFKMFKEFQTCLAIS